MKILIVITMLVIVGVVVLVRRSGINGAMSALNDAGLEELKSRINEIEVRHE